MEHDVNSGSESDEYDSNEESEDQSQGLRRTDDAVSRMTEELTYWCPDPFYLGLAYDVWKFAEGAPDWASRASAQSLITPILGLESGVNAMYGQSRICEQ